MREDRVEAIYREVYHANGSTMNDGEAVRAAIRRFLKPQQSFYQDVKDFHEKFGLEYGGPPRGLDLDLESFRTKFMVEELCEYAGLKKESREVVEDFMASPHFEHRREKVDLEDKLDALVDLAYVVLGTACCHGFDFDEAWRRVHAANMAKVRAQRDEDSLREGGAKFDVVKPPGWKPADLSDLVQP